MSPSQPDPRHRTGPLRAVLDALQQGAPTLAEVRSRTGLDGAVVDAVVAHLIRTGHLDAARFAPGCATGCGQCPVRSGCAAVASPDPAPTARRGARL